MTSSAWSENRDAALVMGGELREEVVGFSFL
jgi:hypothetical protein